MFKSYSLSDTVLRFLIVLGVFGIFVTVIWGALYVILIYGEDYYKLFILLHYLAVTSFFEPFFVL